VLGELRDTFPPRITLNGRWREASRLMDTAESHQGCDAYTQKHLSRLRVKTWTNRVLAGKLLQEWKRQASCNRFKCGVVSQSVTFTVNNSPARLYSFECSLTRSSTSQLGIRIYFTICFIGVFKAHNASKTACHELRG